MQRYLLRTRQHFEPTSQAMLSAANEFAFSKPAAKVTIIVKNVRLRKIEPNALFPRIDASAGLELMK